MTLLARVGLCFDKADELNRLRLPYVFGGGHNPQFKPDPGVDCSSFASIVLRAGGLLAIPRAPMPLVTQAFESWGVPGEGQLLTVWVLDNATTHHCALEFFHVHWAQATHEGGPVGWAPFSPAGFNPRHWPNS
jgi:hypothetical protein